MSKVMEVATDVGVVTVNGDISVWEDQSPSGDNIVQGVEVNRPPLITAGFNGHDVVRFDGSKFLEAITNTVLNFGMGSYTLIIVMVSSNDVDTQRIFGKQDSNSGIGKGYQLSVSAPNNTIAFKVADNSSRRISTAVANAVPKDVLNVVACQFDATAILTALENNGNDIESTVDNSGAMTLTRDSILKFTLGMAQASDSLRFEGDIMYFAAYDSIEDMGALAAPLLAKYSVPPPPVFNDTEQALKIPPATTHYSRQIKTAKRLIKSRGLVGTWKQLTEDNIDNPDQPWLPGIREEADYPVDFVKLPEGIEDMFVRSYRPDTVIPGGLTFGLMASQPFVPKVNDVLVLSNITYNVRYIDILEPDDVPIFYIVGLSE